MKPAVRIFFLLLLLHPPALFSAETQKLPPVPPGPMLLTSVKPPMLDADYWIKKIPNADQPLMTKSKMEDFNLYIRRLIPERFDVYRLDKTRPGDSVKKSLQKTYTALKSRHLFDLQNRDVPKAFFEEKVLPNLGLENIPSRISTRWAAVVRSTSVRALPTDFVMLEKPNDPEFDQLQFTRFKLWTPVGIYHTSRDGVWSFVQGPYARGWVLTKDLALFPSREALRDRAHSEKFLSVLGNKVSIFTLGDHTKLLRHASMGTRIPLRSSSGSGYTVLIPVRKTSGEVSVQEAWISPQADVHIGYPVYSQGNAIRQAFKLLGARYGWGGTYEGRDCSGFTHDVFLSLGLDMPRNSQEQAFVGTKLGYFKPFNDVDKKISALNEARPGITLIAMQHHLMLYIGHENDQFYIIHSTWAERISKKDDTKNRINQVVVSDMNLNGRSYLGSLFDRFITINELA